MTADCAQELCPNWSGDGGVCPCAVFDLERPRQGCGHPSGIHDEFCDQTWYEGEDDDE